MNEALALLMQFKYLVLFPLAAVEGPVVSLGVGFLISTGTFEFVPAYTVLMLGDLIPDTIYYYIGRYGNGRQLLEKYKGRKGFISNNVGLLERLWRDHGKKTMFLSKLAYGLSTPFLISAGLVGMPFRKFISYTIPISLFQYAVLTAVGYYLGNAHDEATSYVKDIGIIVAIVFVFLIVGYGIFTKYAKRELVLLEKEEE